MLCENSCCPLLSGSWPRQVSKPKHVMGEVDHCEGWVRKHSMIVIGTGNLLLLPCVTARWACDKLCLSDHTNCPEHALGLAEHMNA